MTIVCMPEIATGSGSAVIQSWLASAGDSVSAGQAIVEIETEKAVVDYEVDVEGVFAGALLAAGESADVGTPIAVIAVGGQSVEDAMREAGLESAEALRSTASGSAVQAQPEEADPVQDQQDADARPAAATAFGAASAAPSESNGGTERARRQFVSPLVRRLVREQGIDLTGVVGSGPHGRIVRRDLEQLTSSVPASPAQTSVENQSVGVASAGPSSRDTDAMAAGSYRDIAHTSMRRAIARRLSESKATVPHFYLVADCRVDALLDLRAQLNTVNAERFSVNDLIVKAAAWALKEVPEANATWTEDAIRRYDHVDISVAVALPTGLVTPVLRGADRMSLSELSATLRDLADRVREGRLRQQEIEGGAFSVSNLGMYGVNEFTAIINPPQAGILAVGAATRQAVVEADGAIRAATVMRATLSADHRVIDGAVAAQWLAAFTRRIENPLGLLV